jgi:hypothetical protein
MLGSKTSGSAVPCTARLARTKWYEGAAVDVEGDHNEIRGKPFDASHVIPDEARGMLVRRPSTRFRIRQEVRKLWLELAKRKLGKEREALVVASCWACLSVMLKGERESVCVLYIMRFWILLVRRSRRVRRLGARRCQRSRSMSMLICRRCLGGCRTCQGQIRRSMRPKSWFPVGDRRASPHPGFGIGDETARSAVLPQVLKPFWGRGGSWDGGR